MSKTKTKKNVSVNGKSIVGGNAGMDEVVGLDLETEFDPLKAGELVAAETTILEVHVGRPGFKKSINSSHFMRVLGELTESEIAQLSPEMQTMIDEFKAGKLSMEEPAEGEEKDSLDPSMIRVSQDLIDQKALKAIDKHAKRFTNWIKAHAVPSPIKFQGAYLMRLSEFGLIDSVVVQFDEERRVLVNKLGERWDAVVADAKTKRGPFFDVSDYPPFASIKRGFDTEARWLNFNVPKALAKLDADIYRREERKAQLFYADAAQEARDAARVAFQGMTDHLMSQLGNDDSGKPKRFMGTSVTKMQEFITMFLGGGDLTQDGELQKLARKAKDILSGVDAAEVRKQEGLRATLQTAVQAIQQESAKLVVVSKRKFGLGGDPEPVDEIPGAIIEQQSSAAPGLALE